MHTCLSRIGLKLEAGTKTGEAVSHQSSPGHWGQLLQKLVWIPTLLAEVALWLPPGPNQSSLASWVVHCRWGLVGRLLRVVGQSSVFMCVWPLLATIVGIRSQECGGGSERVLRCWKYSIICCCFFLIWMLVISGVYTFYRHLLKCKLMIYVYMWYFNTEFNFLIISLKVKKKSLRDAVLIVKMNHFETTCSMTTQQSARTWLTELFGLRVTPACMKCFREETLSSLGTWVWKPIQEK